MTINEYVEIVSKRLQSGISREHSYRGNLETLIRTLVQDIEITNEPANVTDCGNPDYVITKGKIPVGYIEAKDIGKDLNSKSYKEQFTRYKKALDNLIITDYVWFQFFQNGELIHEIKIGEIENNTVKPIPENYSKFEILIKDFCTHIGQTIKSSKKLAEMMAGKARLLQNILERAITSDEETQENTSLKGQYDTFKDILIHDLTPKGFADIYAQTLAYGMFAARLHDTTLNDFSRQEAAELIPKSNPFLRKLFGYVAGPDIDERIVTVVDNLAEVFRATDIDGLLKNFGKSTQTNDPIIHFYETFLAEYDAKLRKARGVWYTPEPVVNFIVRAVDDILKTEFNLPKGLADTTKTKIKVKTDIANKNFKSGYKEVEKEVHKVQILDPATGTGTFLAEVVKLIYNKNFKAMKGAWSGYVEEHLIPRLNGFELLMASYAMAHLKLDMLLTETGYKSTKNERLNIYLTNSLEEHHKDTGTLFSNWLSSEANEANHIKRDTPVMCVIGNPPYAISSTNKGNWIQGLLHDYKKDLNERKINLDDDYIKFLRYGQYYIDKNGEGILAYISNNSFIDGITHRQMRKHLLESFDKIYVLDLHGNSKKKESSPDGSIDQNVFDIMQGVSINLFVKTGKKKKTELGRVFNFDLYGKREFKYEALKTNSLESIKWTLLKNTRPNFFFTYKNFDEINNYEKGLKIDNLFEIYNSGVKTDRDNLFIDLEKPTLRDRIEKLLTNNFDNEFISRYNVNNSSSYKLLEKIKSKKINDIFLIPIQYRPFDYRTIYYDTEIISRPAKKVTRHLVNKKNIALQLTRFNRQISTGYVFINTYISDIHLLDSAADSMQSFPLYIYNKASEQNTFEQEERVPNLNQEIVNEIAEKLGLTFTNEKEDIKNTFAPIDILDYIYAVLHSPTYREKYKEFLKIDFPRVPYPKDDYTFWKLVKLGGEIRQIHLLESNKVEDYITSYEMEEDAENDHNVITTKIGKKDWEIIDTKKQLGRIWINESKYFDNIPVTAWEFYIGGYQPAQKWLKDRKERELKFEDILHYQKIIVALTETDRLMKEIVKIEIV